MHLGFEGPGRTGSAFLPGPKRPTEGPAVLLPALRSGQAELDVEEVIGPFCASKRNM